MNARGLTARQARFIEEYLVDLNATQAAIRAGYSQKTAYCYGHENLRKPEIQAMIGVRQAELQAAVEVRQKDVLTEYLALAFSDMREHASWGPDGVELTDSTHLTAKAAKAVQEVTSTKRSTTRTDAEGASYTTVEVQTRIKLYNKQAALRDLAEHLQLFSQDKGFDETFLLGFVEVVKAHASDEETRTAILGYLRRYCSAVAA